MNKQTTSPNHPKPTDSKRHKRRVRAAIIGAGLTVVAAGGAAGITVKHGVDAQNRRISTLEAKTNAQDAISQAEQSLTQIEIQDLEARLAATQKEIGRIAEAAGSAIGVKPDTITGANLRQVSELPGYGREVSPELSNKLKQATVKIGKRTKGSGEAWRETCTAVKVLVNGQEYILSASHCFNEDIPSKGFGGKGGRGATAINITDVTPFEYGVLDPGMPTDSRDNQSPLAIATSLSFENDGLADFSILKVNPTNPPGTKGRSYESFEAIEIPGTLYNPLPGEGVSLYGIPDASHNNPVIGNGTYLGRVPAYPGDGNGQLYDLVGINIPSPETDPCNYGGSGSQGMFAGGHLTGPLTQRVNRGYGSDQVMQTNNLDNAQTATSNTFKFSEILDVDLTDKFTTICAYTVPDITTIPTLVASVEGPSIQPHDLAIAVDLGPMK